MTAVREQLVREGLLTAPVGLPSQLTAVPPAKPASVPRQWLHPWERTQMAFKRELHLVGLQLLAPDRGLFIPDSAQLSSLQCRILLLAMHAGHPAALERWQALNPQQQQEVYVGAAALPRLSDTHHRSLRRDVPRLKRAALEAYVQEHPNCLFKWVPHAPIVGRLLASVALPSRLPQQQRSPPPQQQQPRGPVVSKAVEEYCTLAELEVAGVLLSYRRAGLVRGGLTDCVGFGSMGWMPPSHGMLPSLHPLS